MGRMQLFLISVGTVATLLIIWSLWGYFSSRVEQMEYTVEKRTNDYEIRQYPAHIIAETTVVGGTYREALGEGFRIVARYIFGGNVAKQKIAMTAPVRADSPRSESINMTAPVLISEEKMSHTIAFGMPRSYTLDTLPTPTDPRVRIVEVPAKKMAVKRFSMWATNEKVKSKKDALVQALSRDGVTTKGNVQYAGYNAPWTPPWMTRNEVLVEVI